MDLDLIICCHIHMTFDRNTYQVIPVLRRYFGTFQKPRTFDVKSTGFLKKTQNFDVAILGFFKNPVLLLSKSRDFYTCQNLGVFHKKLPCGL